MMLMALTLATATNTKAQDEPKLEVKPTARILFDAAYINADHQEDDLKSGVGVPDIRVGLGFTYGQWKGKIDMGYAYGKVNMKDVWMQYTFDIMQYMWGKTMCNDPERAAIAIRDAEYGLDCIIREFSEPFGLQISKEDTPEFYKVMREGTATCDSICKVPKRYYMRKRPFMRFNETTLTPDDEESLRKNGSYPSGHTILGWNSALLLSEINPDRADTILARGYMYGDSLIIVGAHWQSDVNAGRLAASAAYARLHTSERFLEQMRLARLEFRCKTGLATAAELKAYKKRAKARR